MSRPAAAIKAMEGKPDRILVVLPVIEGGPPAWGAWGDAMAAQQTKVLWDVLVIDTTDQPSEEYMARAREWSKSKPFGSSKVRLKHFTDEPHIITPGDHHVAEAFADNVDVEDEPFKAVGQTRTVFSADFQRVAWARAVGSRYFQKWGSYSHLLYADPEVLPPPHATETLYRAFDPWVAAWLPPAAWGIPEVWHDLKREDVGTEFDPHDKGYVEPPGRRLFDTTATHLAFTLTHREIHDAVDFQTDFLRSDLTFSWQASAAGFTLFCNPQVECGRVGASPALT